MGKDLALHGVDDVWEHAGLTCVLRHAAFGAPCGYVMVPQGHPLYGAYYDDVVGVDVHGGPTFSGRIEGVEGWALGFDMAHFGDVDPLDGYVLRTDGECVAETECLAEQLAERGQ